MALRHRDTRKRHSLASKPSLVVNEGKTKYMVAGYTARHGPKVSFGTYEFDWVNEFTYLGSQVKVLMTWARK